MRRLVTVETPLMGHPAPWVPKCLRAFTERVLRARNKAYARACLRHSLLQLGEAPYASHLMFDQPGVLDDASPFQRAVGMSCGALWDAHAQCVVLYCDLGISSGMNEARLRAVRRGIPVEYRMIGTGSALFFERRVDAVTHAM